MWSVKFNGRHSQFAENQRILFHVQDGSEATSGYLMRVLRNGVSRGLLITNPDDDTALRIVQQALDTVRGTELTRTAPLCALIVKTGAAWQMTALHDRMRHVTDMLGVERIDTLLLNWATVPASTNIYDRKRAVISCWDYVIRIQQLGLVQQIGVCDFATQDLEFILTAFPEQAPSAACITLQLSETLNVRPLHPTFQQILAFAHARQIDLLVCMSRQSLINIPKAEVSGHGKWQEVVEKIARRSREQLFDLAVVNEADKEPFRIEPRDTKTTDALQSSLQILVRYFLQKGTILVPLSENAGGGELDGEHNFHQLFFVLPHPFTGLDLTHSPHTQCTSVLTRECMQEIEQCLTFVVPE